jgi:DNA-directed RNA polymerase subunit RPC12/RpoP
MAVSNESELTCADCGVKITGVPVVPSTGEGPTQAQVEKLKPTVYLCTECAEERGLSFNGIAIGKTGTETPPPAP